MMINSVCGIRSTGRICTDIAEELEKAGHTCKIGFGRESVPEKYAEYAVRIGTPTGVNVHGGLSRIFDDAGFHSKAATKKFLKWVEEYDPDVIHLHNIHGYYLHIGELFKYLKKANKPVVWSLHDCWSFTGHCAHFDGIGCEKWKTGCYGCPQKKLYPTSLLLDNSKRNYKKKKSLFQGLQNLTLVVPSVWLATKVAQSYLGEYSTKIIPNGIDLSVFRPTKSNFREKYGLTDKKIVLGVATAWSKNKGIEDFIALSKTLGEEYQVVLVGVKSDLAPQLPKEILALPRTNNVQELAEIYTAADVFFNPSIQETMGLTTVEAMACGTPAIVYDKTAVPEVVTQRSGIVLPCSIRGFKEAFERATALDKADILAQAEKFEKGEKFGEYIRLYEGCMQ